MRCANIDYEERARYSERYHMRPAFFPNKRQRHHYLSSKLEPGTAGFPQSRLGGDPVRPTPDGAPLPFGVSRTAIGFRSIRQVRILLAWSTTPPHADSDWYFFGASDCYVSADRHFQ